MALEAAAKLNAALHAQQLELDALRAEVEWRRVHEEALVAEIRMLRAQMKSREPRRIQLSEGFGFNAERLEGNSKAEEAVKVKKPELQTDEPRQIALAETVLKKPRQRANRRNRGPRAPSDGLNLRQREEGALRRLEGSASGLAELLAEYCNASKEARLDIRVLAARLYFGEVTSENARAKLLEFQDSVADIASGFALTPKEKTDLASAFTKAATERLKSSV